MKKTTAILTAFLILFFSNSIFAADTLQVDEEKIRNAVNAAMLIAETITKHSPLIPFIPNEITATALTSAAAFLIRFFAKRRLRKKGLLIDKNIADSQKED
jgi:hypothetical protein